MSSGDKRDRLDGTQTKSRRYEYFLMPGRFILWLQYMFPGSTYKEVRMSSRHARSPYMTYIYSVVFWCVIGFGVLALIAELANFLP